MLGAAWPTAGNAQESTPSAGAVQPFSGETFVGPTSDPNAFVAIVIGDEDEDGREARAYLCNGADVIEWFDQGGLTGEGDGQLDLRTSDGARLAGTVSEATVTGEVTLPDGKLLTFEADHASGAEGLFTSTVETDGHVAGISAEGAQLEGQLRITGTITLPNSTVVPYEWDVAIDDTAKLRTIVLGNSSSRGGGRKRDGSELRVAQA